MLPRGSVLLLSLSVWISSTCWEKVLAQQPSFQLNITTTPPTCEGDKGIIVVNPSGGTAPYSYSFDGSPPQYSGILAIGDGTIHYIEVTDAMGTKATTTVTLPTGDIPSITVTNVIPISGCGMPDGVISVQGSGGVPPYTYSTDKNIWSYRQDFVGLSAGYYILFVKDAKGCIQFTTYNMKDCVNPTISVGNSLCGSGGVINIMVSGAHPPYTYSLTGVSYQSIGTFTQLVPQTYTVRIRDGNGATYLCHAVVLDQCGLDVTAQAQEGNCGRQDAAILVTASRGVAPYLYSIDGVHFQSSNIFTGLRTGRYSVLVVDAAGARELVPVQVTDNCQYPLSATTDPTIPTCGKPDATITVTANGGTAPYQYNLDGGPFQNGNVFTGAAQGLHSLSVKDAVGAVVTIGTQVQATAGVTADGGGDLSLCAGQAGQIMAVSNGASFSWEPVTGLDDATVLQPKASPSASTTYTLTARTGVCEATATVNVIVHSNPEVYAGRDTAILKGQPLPLHAVDINNTGFDSWSWDPPEGLDNAHGQAPLAHPEENVVYTVIASTASGCSASAQIAVKVFSVAGIFVPSAFTPNGDGHNDVLRAIPMGIREFWYFAVWNRWGQRVFYTTDPGVGWDGGVGGRPGEAGAYIWKVSGLDYKGDKVLREGTVFLIR
ncbi:MAG TPA: gliding motility-associated C-terminal domain-containing protein [Puia sp.]|nr:gliding motility-associated C-terminal domain-containing protein [Puia sp.]